MKLPVKFYQLQVTWQVLEWVIVLNVHDQNVVTSAYRNALSIDSISWFVFDRKQKKDDDHSSKYDVARFKGQTLIADAADDTSSILYRPKTQETKQTYEVLLGFIQESVGDQARSILCGAADEVLIILKNDKLRDKDRKNEIEKLLSTKIPEQRFAFLVNLGKKITDWATDDKSGKDG